MPPLWVAARDPNTYDWAMKNGLNVMATPLSQPFSEVENLAGQVRARRPGRRTPAWRDRGSRSFGRLYVYDSPDDWMVPVEAARDKRVGIFEALFTETEGASSMASRNR